MKFHIEHNKKNFINLDSDEMNINIDPGSAEMIEVINHSSHKKNLPVKKK